MQLSLISIAVEINSMTVFNLGEKHWGYNRAQRYSIIHIRNF